jgi:hypothetical protein
MSSWNFKKYLEKLLDLTVGLQGKPVLDINFELFVVVETL